MATSLPLPLALPFFFVTPPLEAFSATPLSFLPFHACEPSEGGAAVEVRGCARNGPACARGPRTGLTAPPSFAAFRF